MAPNDSPSQPIGGVRDTITVLGDHSDVRAEENTFEEVSQATERKATKRKATKRKATKRKATKRKATKRKATSSAPKTPTAKKRHGKSKTSSPLIERPSRRDEITKRYMEILFLCKEEGLLNSNETSFWEPVWDKSWDPVWDKLLFIFSCEFPGIEWTKELLQRKYDIERSRYQRFITFLRYPGTSYDEATGMVTGSNAFFKAFLSQYSGSWWLPNEPLGNYGVYKEVFWREKPSRFKLHFSEDDTAGSEQGRHHGE